MGSSGRVDQATIAFRRVLAEANVGEQARVDALVVLSQRTVYAATWPGQNQAARTLTNSEGESALPLFTGLDVLETTATRFGWRNADGSLQFRELGAREALRHALARGVHFVVVDIGCEHSVEFAREELEPLMQLQALRGGTGPFAASGERQAAILDAVRRSSSRPPRSSAIAANHQVAAAIEQRVARDLEPLAPPRESPASARETQPSPPMAAAALRRRPSSQSIQTDLPSAALTQMAAELGTSGAGSGSRGSAAESSLQQASADASDANQPPSASMKQAAMQASGASAGIQATGPNPVGRPTGANPVMEGTGPNTVLKPTGPNTVLKPTGPNTVLKPTGPNPVVKPTGANPVVKATGPNPLRQTGPNQVQKQAALAAELAQAAEGAPSESMAGAAAKARPPTAAEAFGNRESGTGGQKNLPKPPRDDEPTIADRGSDKALSAPRVALPDDLLKNISGGLRGFPEVEWACVLSDGSEIPLIGLRVDPSFLNRVADIADAVMDAGEKHEAELQVMLLNNQELVKNARRHGKAFYPWRR